MPWNHIEPTLYTRFAHAHGRTCMNVPNQRTRGKALLCQTGPVLAERPAGPVLSKEAMTTMSKLVPGTKLDGLNSH